MNHFLRLQTSLLVARTPLIYACLCGTAWAQSEGIVAPVAADTTATANTAPTPGPAVPEASTTAPAPPAAEQRGPIHVTVSLTGYDLSADTVSSAIARDLGLSLTPDATLAQCRFVVEAERGKNLALTFYGTNGLTLKRVVRAPEASTDVSEIAALLAVNLVRDEAPQLLPLLTPKPVEPAPVPKAEPAKAPATKPPPVSTKGASAALPFIPANGTFVAPLTIIRNVDERTVGFELGLVYSDVGAVDGAGINAVVLRTRSASHGVLIAGAVGMVGQRSESAASDQLALSGVQISGAASFVAGNLNGAQISGAASSASGNVEGVQISGAASVATGNVDGAQISGAANVSGNFEGFQTSGALNFANGNVDGAQISGAANVAQDVDGAQISLVNIGKQVNGAQIGLVNIGGRVSGAQIGLVNIAEEVDGASIGIITYSKKGRTQITSWFDSTRPVNVGVRFVSGPLYALPSVGADPRNTEAFDFSLSLGARIPVERLYFDIDGNSRMSFDDGSVRESNIDLRYRLTAGYQVMPWLGVFAGGGVHHYFNAEENKPHNVKPFWCVGVDLL